MKINENQSRMEFSALFMNMFLLLGCPNWFLFLLFQRVVVLLYGNFYVKPFGYGQFPRLKFRIFLIENVARFELSCLQKRVPEGFAFHAAAGFLIPVLGASAIIALMKLALFSDRASVTFELADSFLQLF